MGHGKETPRQKMIGMMYLVLTALLALNVSKDILNAFALVDEGLSKTTENFTEKNELLYDEFDKLALSNPAKVKPYKEKADEVRKRANALYNRIQELKIQLVLKADGKDGPAIDKNKKITIALINSKDNTNIPSEIMIGDNNDKEAKKLKKELDDYRDALLKMVDKRDVGIINSINATIDTKAPKMEGGKTESWESEHFEHLPLIAVTTIMSNLQNNVRNAESEITKYLYNQIEASSFKFNKLEPTVIPNSNYIIKGNEYNAEVFIAAFDTTQKPTIFYGTPESFTTADGKLDWRIAGGSRDSLPILNGKGLYKKLVSSAAGTVKWGGIIQLKNTDGSLTRKPFKAEYQVAEASSVVSPTKMNVFYMGVDNPVDISIAGVPNDRVTATINNGTITREKDSWIVRVTKGPEAVIQVGALMDKTSKVPKMMDKKTFRVKKIPDPSAQVAGQSTGSVTKNLLLAQYGVFAELKDFDFDAKFAVKGFEMSATIKGFVQKSASSTNGFTAAQKAIIANLNVGDEILFSNITAIGPDKAPRDLNAIQLKIK